MDHTLIQLHEAVNVQNTQKVKENLRTIIIQAANIDLTETDIFETLLGAEDEDLLMLTVQSIAELAKSAENRKLFTKNEIINSLLGLCKMLKTEAYFQCFRAIGNICYENDKARQIVDLDGIQVLIRKVDNMVDVLQDTDPKILSTLSGCLLNVLMANDDLQKAALKCNILLVIEKILLKIYNEFEEREDCIAYLLQILSFVTDHMMDQWITEEMCCLLINILRISENPEISILCLEVLRVQSEYDDIKLCLAKQGACELVYELVEKYGSQADDEESRSVLKMACDLIVLILIGDASMNLLYDNGHGKVFKQMISWVDSNDIDLLTTGVLAIGNFARNDSHCIYMVDSGLSKKLLGVLSKNNTTGADVKLQHALLSALRHLSIPAQNKSKLIHETIIKVLYSMIYIDHAPVVFKLMGTFRMLVDGQEKTALDLVVRKELIERIIYWCYNSDHLGVHAEAPRLLAWLIKNCHSLEPIPIIVAVPDSIKCLVEMIASTHAVMQNEALIALNLICSYCMNTQVDSIPTETETGNIDHLVNNMNLDNQSNYNKNAYVNLFINADIGKNVAFIINKNCEKMEEETISNFLALLDQLIKSKDIVEHLKTSNLHEALLLLSKNKNASGLSEKINKLLAVCK